MADCIPSVILTDILCRLPPNSLIRFTSVSKEWKLLIHSSDFNSDYMVRQAHRKRLIITHCGFINERRNHTRVDDVERIKPSCLIFDDDDDDTFPQQRICLTYPRSVNQLKVVNDLDFFGSSHGLLCFSGYHIGECDTFIRCVIWNPSIRKSVAIDVPYYRFVSFAFGVCPKSLDPKIVKINTYDVPRWSTFGYKDEHRVWRVEVYTLSSRVWRSPLTKLSNDWFDINIWSHTPLVIDGFIYWFAYEGHINHMIVSFDLTSEEFTKINLPDDLSHSHCNIIMLRDSVGVVETDGTGSLCNVWLMDHVSKSFTKLFTVESPESLLFGRPLGLRDNNQLIIGMRKSNSKSYAEELFAYEPNSNNLNNLGMYFDQCSSSLNSYTESLLLLDHSDTINDDEDDAHINCKN